MRSQRVLRATRAALPACAMLSRRPGRPGVVPAITAALALSMAQVSTPAAAALLTNGPDVVSGGPPIGGTFCADVADAIIPSIGHPTKVWIYPCHGWANQQWSFQNYSIMGLGSNVTTQYCLDVQNAVFKAGTPVNLYPCNGFGSQLWYFTNGYIASATDAALCLDSGALASFSQLTVEACKIGKNTQQWQIK